MGGEPEVPLHHDGNQKARFSHRVGVEPETDSDAVVDRAHEAIENDRDGPPKADAGTFLEIAPSEKQMGLRLERVVRVRSGLLDDRLLGAHDARSTEAEREEERGE